MIIPSTEIFSRAEVRTLSTMILSVVFGSFLFTFPTFAATHAPVPPTARREPCGLVDDYLGDVQILDPERASLTDVKIKNVIYCGTSVTIGKGWAQLRSQNGSRIHIGDQTMIRFPERQIAVKSPTPPKETENLEATDLGQSSAEATSINLPLAPDLFPDLFKDDHVILFKGQIYVQTYDDEEFRIVSATGRVRVTKGKAIVTFSPQSEATQLIALENTATLENRFATDQRIRVSPGESSELNFKLLRVIPQIPTAISVASLRPKLVELEVPEKDLWSAIHTTLARQKKNVVDPLLRPTVQRKPASVVEKKPNYFRQSAKSMTKDLRKQWIDQIAGDARVGETVLSSAHPEKAHLGAKQSADSSKQVASDVTHQKAQTLQAIKEAQEKRRIINELSQIHPE